MTSAAVYVRVSTDEQALSAEAQERDARRFAEARGWTVAEVYADVGVSGAEWTSRPQLTRMLADATRPGRGWDVALLRDLDRLGRDAARTALALEDLHDAGVRVLEYSTGAEVQQDPMAKVLLATRAAFGEYERAMTSARTRGAHLDLARRGYVTGGRTYGYKNVRTPEGVLREPDPTEAEIVREIYARRIAGETPGVITRALNARGVPSPRAPGWNLGGVAALLRNACYKGEIEWGKTRKAYRKGSKVTRLTDPGERLRLTVPALVIVDPETWQAAQWKSPALPRGGRTTHVRNLLSGLLRCGRCGGPAQAQATRWSGAQVLVYRCAWSYQRGVSVCPVRSRKPVAQVDAAVLEWLRTHVLSAEVVTEAVGQAVDQLLSEATAPDRGADLRAELARVEGEARRLAEALAKGGDLEALLTTLRAREGRAKALQVEIAELGAAEGVRTVGREALEREALSRAADLRELLGRDVAGARKVLTQVIGRLTFTPGEGRGAPWSIEVAGTPITPPWGTEWYACYGNAVISV